MTGNFQKKSGRYQTLEVQKDVLHLSNTLLTEGNTQKTWISFHELSMSLFLVILKLQISQKNFQFPNTQLEIYLLLIDSLTLF